MTEEAKKTETKATATAATKKDEKPEWKGTYEDVTDHQRQFSITEPDGTAIEVPMNWPGRVVAENMNGLSYKFVDGDVIDTLGTYHEALLGLFGKAKVNGKYYGELDMSFFEKPGDQTNRNATFNYLMNGGDSFLTGKLN